MNKVVCGSVTLIDKYLVSGNCCLQHARNGESLTYDTLDIDVWFDNTEFPPITGEDNFVVGGDNFVTSDSFVFMTYYEMAMQFLDEFKTGAVAQYYFDDVLIGKFYIDSIKQTSTYRYSVSCVSSIGVLENSMHYGGIYNGTALSVILAEIFQGIPITIDSAVGSLKIYGYLPYDTKRNNLQQITIATNLAIKLKSDGIVQVTALTSNSVGTITKERVAIGGKVDTLTPCTAIKVIEHNYTVGTEVITLCETAFTSIETIIFSEPAHTLVITNGTILSSGANFAIIQGSGSVLLTGKKYNHTTKEITRGTIIGNSSDKIVTVNSATLVNTLNSSSVATRLYDVYKLDRTISESLIVDQEKPGSVVGIVNPYTLTEDEAFMQQLDIDMGNFLKAEGEFLIGFRPSGASSGYKNKALITTSSTFTVPAGVTEIRPVLIGGGNGGGNGLNGLPGGAGTRISGTPSGETFTTTDFNGNGGEEGKGGLGGIGGKTNDLGAIAVTPGQTYTITIGAGGPANSVGGNTIFGAFSSATGLTLADGYTDIVTGTAYAQPGNVGVDGKKGMGKDKQSWEYILAAGVWYYDGSSGGSYWYWIGSPKKWLYGIGGSGGGTASGENGANGANGEAEYNQGNGFATGGKGGDGGDSIVAGIIAIIYGSGGGGGNGGGGGGGGGGYVNPVGGATYEWPGQGGLGGIGSAGGTGKSGCVIIYY